MLQAEHRETYLFLGSSTQKPRAGENRARQHEWGGEKSKEGTQAKMTTDIKTGGKKVNDLKMSAGQVVLQDCI